MKELPRNAIITSATIMIEDHGFLTAWLQLDYGGAGQGFGGYGLYSTGRPENGFNYAGHFIYRVLQIAGVERWSDLPGKTVRVDASNMKVEGIGHIVKDDWFYPSKDFAEKNGGEA